MATFSEELLSLCDEITKEDEEYMRLVKNSIIAAKSMKDSVKKYEEATAQLLAYAEALMLQKGQSLPHVLPHKF